MYANKFDAVIDQYFDFLIREDLVFFNKNPELFPEINLDWKSSSTITNAIVDFGYESAGSKASNQTEIENILLQLDDLGCKSVQLRGFSDISLEIWKDILMRAEGLRICSIEILTKYLPEFDEKSLFDLCQRYTRLSLFTAHSAPFSGMVYGSSSGIGHIYFTEESINSHLHCGKIMPDFFTVNISTFTESNHYNSCLNRKISIDAGGQIKNCPSMAQSFGHISNTTLREAVNNPEFRKYWHITKDQVNVCKDCEFRHVCTDCRAFLETPDDPLSKPLKCGYDPYTAQWAEWSMNPLKQNAADHYGMTELLPEFKLKPDYVTSSNSTAP
jgi:SPASM domain peptide maturase of grasp-with-spasm system